MIQKETGGRKYDAQRKLAESEEKLKITMKRLEKKEKKL